MSNASSAKLPERGQLVLISSRGNQVTLLVGPDTVARQESGPVKSKRKADLVYRTECEYFIQRNGPSRRLCHTSSIEVGAALGCSIVFSGGGEPSSSSILWHIVAFLAGGALGMILHDLLKLH
ncbi:uncharacterized protein F4812DRAFT_467320 [Daldinia caldariorum]|uniref:uncharacterized protein n=1 Tax=Daldinia caldariorum TaxID=326644 RepID=UPI002007255D|nr:uncharacterized protein F4812DRAFT_467320 [Daldinia caldariorum]KAI1471105.1 hypothetical protein F4812DRAFT_467320 [Daldinia caldariorum]